jgi:hypothetical protein
MNKLKLIAVIAVAGALGLSARAASVPNVDLVTVKAAVLLQNTNPIVVGETTKFAVTKVKITTKDILGLIDNEFHTAYATINGTQLAVESFGNGAGNFAGSVVVLDKGGNVINADAGEASGDPDYGLGIEFDNAVATASATDDTKGSAEYRAASDFFYESADDSTFFAIGGAFGGVATVDQTFKNATASETFSLTGGGDAEINGSEGVITDGSVKGSSKNNDNVEFLTPLFGP